MIVASSQSCADPFWDLQLLEHGADVHNHGAKTDQTPLRMAVTDLNLDVRMVELLVSYGGSPFLEAKDGKHAHSGGPACPHKYQHTVTLLPLVCTAMHLHSRPMHATLLQHPALRHDVMCQQLLWQLSLSRQGRAGKECTP